MKREGMSWFAGLAVVIAAAFLAVGYALAGLLWGIAVAGGIAVLWLIGIRQRWRWTGGVSLLLFVLSFMVGLFLGVMPVWTILSLVSALAAWNQESFRRELESAVRVYQQEQIEHQFRQRLLIVTVLGGIMSLTAAVLRINYGFGLALLLGFLSITGLSLAISYLRRESD